MLRSAVLLLLAFALVFATACTAQTKDMIILKNSQGMEVRAIPYGGIITSIRVPDRNGRFDDVVLGYDTADAYIKNNGPFMGAIIGRYGNRIAKGKFTLDGQTYTLATNNGPNHLHGGNKGFDKVTWQPQEFHNADGTGVTLQYTSADGEEGYPGKLTVRVTYTLTDRNELIVDYFATADKATPVNLTQHSYFNLAGGTRDVLDHEMTIYADRYTPVDATLIPTGRLEPVDGTPFDFRKAATIGSRINDDHEQLRMGMGYDHNFVLNRTSEGLVHAAHVYEPSTGRVLDVSTTEPGMQFYSANFLDGSITGKSGHVYQRRFAFCLETQHFPDSPNQPQFPSTILRPGSEYRSRTVFAFSVDATQH
jgi:aldose 1-epimerase